MLLAIDVGNTNVTLGVFDEDRLVVTWRLASDRERLADEYAVVILGLLGTAGIDPRSVNKAVITSGVSVLTTALEEVCRRYFGAQPLRIGAGIKTGMRI